MMTARITRWVHGIPRLKISLMSPISGDSFSFPPPLAGEGREWPLVGYWMPKPEIEERRGVGEMLRAPEHDNQDRAAVPRRGGGQAVAGGAGIAGLDPDRARIGPEQPIDVGRVER